MDASPATILRKHEPPEGSAIERVVDGSAVLLCPCRCIPDSCRPPTSVTFSSRKRYSAHAGELAAGRRAMPSDPFQYDSRSLTPGSVPWREAWTKLWVDVKVVQEELPNFISRASGERFCRVRGSMARKNSARTSSHEFVHPLPPLTHPPGRVQLSNTLPPAVDRKRSCAEAYRGQSRAVPQFRTV